MEPKLLRKDMNYQKKILVIVSVLVITLFIGGSFALLSSSSKVEEAVTFKTGELNMKVTITGTLTLEGEAPKSYEDGFKTEDITLTLTNTGTLEIGKYEIKLEGDSTTNLQNNYIRYSVSEDEGKTYLAAKLLSETNNIIYTGYNLKTSKVLKLKIWIDEEAGANALNKIYNGKIKAELYQKGDSDTAVQVVKSKLVSNYSGDKKDFPGGLVAVNNDGDLYHEVNSETVREYRYSGPNVNNYVTFNDELWRILGVFKDEAGVEHVKLIRNTAVEIEKLPSKFIKNDVEYIILNDGTFTGGHENYIFFNKNNQTTVSNDFSTAGLQYYLNNEEDENGNKGYLNYLNNDAKNMIQKSTYYLGNVKFIVDDLTSDNAITSYQNERKNVKCASNVVTKSHDNNCNIWPNNQATWEGIIGLIYPSDIGFSASSSYWSVQLNWGIYQFNTEAKNSNWLAKNSLAYSFFTISPSSYSTVTGNSWNSGGCFDPSEYLEVNEDPRAIYPSLYLKSDVEIASGTGTKDNPYSLTIE